MSFVHLHVRSYYSLLEGLLLPSRLVELAKSDGMTHLALTDHLSLGGVVEFFQACKTHAIQPVIGMEINLDSSGFLPAQGAKSPRQNALILLAQDMTGWANLCRLLALILDDPDKDANSICSPALLQQYAGGLICLTGGRRSTLYDLINHGKTDTAAAWLDMLQQSFPDRLYIELQQAEASDQICAGKLTALAARLGIPIAASHDVFYEKTGQAALYRTLTAICTGKPVRELDATLPPAPPASFLFSSEINSRFSSYPEAVANTAEIARRCTLQLPFGVAHFPKVDLPQGSTAGEVLRNKAFSGAKRLYGKITPLIQSRLETELVTIEGLGFEPIFLIMEEILQFARQTGVPTSSRGSASSSLVAHCLGITRPDPLAHNLYFERFLNPARSTPPDIDTDLCSRRRELVIQHVFTQYGHDRVAMVGTVNRFRPRSALYDVAKAHGLSPEEAHNLSGRLPYAYAFRMSEDEDPNPPSPFAELRAQYRAAEYQAIFTQAEEILGLPRHFSVHPGGIVITPGRVTDLLPVQQAARGITITQFDHHALEPLGVVKLDLLGIRGLTVLGDVAESIYNWRQRDFKTRLDVLEMIPHEDPQTAERVRTGKTIGCFQIESPGMRATLKEINAASIEDILAALALYRPGPLTGGLKEAFVRRHNGSEDIRHLHPALAPLLDDTYGVILYQEQVLRIAHELAGLTLAESDLLRRAMSHFNPGKQMETLRSKFVAGAVSNGGLDEITANRVWELMAAFAGYGFPKAHAASYALVAWQSAWCKTHYPAEFMAAVLANWGGYYSQRVYMMEARRMGLQVKAPHVNHSRRDFSVTYPAGQPVLYMGLDQVRDLTQKTQEKIIKHRPFFSVEDFVHKTRAREQETRNLIRCGAFDGLETIPQLLHQLDQGIDRSGQMGLFSGSGFDLTPVEDWSPEMVVQAQEEVLGISVNYHPLELLAGQIQQAGALTTAECIEKIGQRVTVAGTRQVSRRVKTAKGEMMMFLSLEDMEGMIDVVLFSNTYTRYRSSFTGHWPLLVEGVMEQDAERNEPVLRAERVVRLG